MKLSDWAKQNGLTYKTAYRMFKTGQLPRRSQQLPTGTILVFPDDADPGLKRSQMNRRIEVLYIRYRGDLDRIQQETGYPADYLQTWEEDFKKKLQQDSRFWVANGIATTIQMEWERTLQGRDEVRELLRGDLARLVSDCCGALAQERQLVEKLQGEAGRPKAGKKPGKKSPRKEDVSEELPDVEEMPYRCSKCLKPCFVHQELNFRAVDRYNETISDHAKDLSAFLNFCASHGMLPEEFNAGEAPHRVDLVNTVCEIVPGTPGNPVLGLTREECTRLFSMCNEKELDAIQTVAMAKGAAVLFVQAYWDYVLQKAKEGNQEARDFLSELVTRMGELLSTFQQLPASQKHNDASPQ